MAVSKLTRTILLATPSLWSRHPCLFVGPTFVDYPRRSENKQGFEHYAKEVNQKRLAASALAHHLFDPFVVSREGAALLPTNIVFAVVLNLR